MTISDTRTTHPVWCVNYPEPGRRGGTCVHEHVGADRRLDTGETFAYAISVEPLELVAAGDGMLPRARLRISERESIGSEASAYLTLDEVNRLKDMLDRVAGDLGMSDVRG